MTETIEGTKATILPIGVPLLNSSDVTWELTSGVQPYIGTYEIAAGSQSAIKEMAVEGYTKTETSSGEEYTHHMMNTFSLLIETAGGTKLEVKNLSVMDFPPGENEHISRIRLADRRWLWPFNHVLKRYNIRRQIGNRRIERRDRVMEMEDTVPSIWFAEYSLLLQGAGNTSMHNLWRPVQILDDVFGSASYIYEGQVGANFIKRGIGSGHMRFTDAAKLILEGIAVENLVIDAAGDQAIAQALSFMPGLKVYIDIDGYAVFDAVQGGGEAHNQASVLPEMVGGGHVKFMDNSLTRPSEIVVLFTREHELRFDYLEQNNGGVVIPRFDEDMAEHRLMENVVPVPDFELEVENEKLCQGTWITINQALLAWGLPPAIRLKTGAPTLDYDLLLKAFLPFQDIFAAIGLVGQLQVDADWPPRISVLQENFRRTFRINPFWWDRILSIKAQAISVVDPVSGTRAPAEVYTDYSIVPGLRGFLKRTLAQTPPGGPGAPPVTLATRGLTIPSHAYFINVFGYPRGGLMNNGGSQFDKDTKACPCKLVIADHQQGIITFQYLIDPYRTMEMILPSPVGVQGRSGIIVSNNNYPLCTPTRLEAPIGWDMINTYATNAGGTGSANRSAEEISLLAEHKVAIIISAIPAGDEESLYPVHVKPEDVASALERAGLPKSSQARTAGGAGPRRMVRVGAQVLKAQVAWDDLRAEDIERAFGIRTDQPAGAPAWRKLAYMDMDNTRALLNGLVLNEEYNQVPNMTNQVASLQVLAMAAAARIWAATADRFEGRATGDMTPSMQPEGWTDSVIHTLKPDGTAQTSFTIPPDIPAIDLMQYLDANTRRLILNMVVDPQSL